MSKVYIPVLLIGLFVSCQPERTSLINDRVDSVMNTIPDFSGVVLVAAQGKPVYYKSFGYLDFRTKTKLDTNAVFELASVSKQFTAMTIMMLQEEGKLNFDDSLKSFFPELPYPGITIRHLLNHTSGLPDYLSVMDQYWDKSKVAGNKECIEYLSKYHPPKEFEPGTQYQYNNTGYLLLASITEKVSGKDFIGFIRQRIFQPIKLPNTNIRTKEEKLLLGNFAWGHIFVPEKNQFIAADSFPSSNYTIWLGNRKGPGRISSTAADLLKWDQALYTSKLVSETSFTEAFTPAKLKNDTITGYGFGWTIQSSNLGKVVRHGGDNPGYKTHIVRYIEKNRTIILLCNNAHPKFNEVLKFIENEVQHREFK